MPNWCEGDLRICGKAKDIYKFIDETIDRNKKVREKSIEIERWHDEDIWFIGTRRMFMSSDYFCEAFEDKSDIKTNCIRIKQAWCIDSGMFVEWSKKYKLDFRIVAFERGMQFEQQIEVIKGKLIKDEVITYNEKNRDWYWDCICPSMGG